MKKIISVLTFVFVSHILIERVELYNLTCPPEANWNIRAKAHCNSTSKYFCLYNNVKEIYVEGCNGPDWDRKGSKRLYSGSFTRGNCSHNHYQPFLYWTNGSSDCMFAKSVCGEKGQLPYKEDSTKVDRACNCDYTRNYSFIKTPRNLCYCIPTEEDCSCYIKQCLVNNTLSADYECIEKGYHKETKCRQINNRHTELLASMEHVTVETVRLRPSKTILKINRKISSAVIILTIFYAVAIVLASVIPKLTIDGQKVFKRCYPICQKGNLSTEEINYLRLVRLLFKVAHPVVRKLFDNVITPNQLRTTLDRNKTLLEKQYRDTDVINDFQWNLLYDPVKGKTVTSQNFDITLMLLLVRTLVNYEISDVYEDKSDQSAYAIFSRIKYVRNEITCRFAGKLSKSLFDQYRDDISQTLQEIKHTEHGQAETKQIDCLGVVRCVQKATCFKLPGPTIEENNFLVVFHVIAIIVYPVLQKAYNTCTPLEKNKTEQHQTHCSDEESKNLYIKMMLDTLIQSAKQNGESDRIIHLEKIKDIQREIVQSCSGVLIEKRFHEILKSLQEAVSNLGGTFSEEKLLEFQNIKNILE